MWLFCQMHSRWEFAQSDNIIILQYIIGFVQFFCAILKSKIAQCLVIFYLFFRGQ
jgi:hypothetical protein